MEAVLPIMSQFPEIETCVEVSGQGHGAAEARVCAFVSHPSLLPHIPVLCQEPEEHLRAVLLCSEGRATPHSPPLRP